MEIRKVNIKINKLTESIYAGVDNSILIPESKKLAEKDIQKSINIDRITKVFADFKNIINSRTYKQQHYAIKTFLKDHS